MRISAGVGGGGTGFGLETGGIGGKRAPSPGVLDDVELEVEEEDREEDSEGRSESGREEELKEEEEGRRSCDRVEELVVEAEEGSEGRRVSV